MDAEGLIGAPPRIRGRARPAELVALALALAERDGLEESERRRLDREIGTQASGAQGLALLRAWLTSAPSAGLERRIQRLSASLAMLAALVTAIGVFFGWAAAAALLSIEVHEGRINIVLCVALLVLLPAAGWALSLLGWLWSILGSRKAGIGPSFGKWLLGGGLARAALRLLPQSVREDVEVVMGRVTVGGRLYADVERGQLLLWSQLLGLGFGLGALVATLLFVVFTDLAFGWSTTLEVGAEPVYGIVRALAAPWAWLWPEASPPLELVEATRFYRVASEDHIHFVDPIVYGGWWPFLVMAIGTFAVLPRAATACAVSVWLSRATARAMGFTPGVERLLDRLTTPLVDTKASSAEGVVGRPEGGLVPEVDLAHWWATRAGEGTEPCLIRWAELASDSVLRAAMGAASIGPSSGIREAGGRRSLDQDADLARECSSIAGAVAVCVRGYEPPLLDFIDFLAGLRAQMGPERGLAVVLCDAREADLATWRRKLVVLGDPRLVVGRISLEPVAAGGLDG